jgi:hypothetical protein
VPAQSLRDWHTAFKPFAEDSGSFSLANTLLTMIQLDPLFAEPQFDKNKADKLVARLKTVKNTSVAKLAEALHQKNMREVAARIVVMDTFFKEALFQQDAFEKQLDEEIRK